MLTKPYLRYHDACRLAVLCEMLEHQLAHDRYLVRVRVRGRGRVRVRVRSTSWHMTVTLG
eukprot:scaffold80585_cov48-Phaeocystis_antarctica.AAC.1